MKHTTEELKQWQSLPLDVKIMMSCDRIREWVREFREDGTYISFSGGKDSTVLLDLVRNRCGYTDIPALFIDVPTQYPELRDFAKTFENVEIIRPNTSFMEVCEKYGFPLISKEVSKSVYYARKSGERNVHYQKLFGLGKYKESRFSQKQWSFLYGTDFMLSNKCCDIMKKEPALKYERKHKRYPFIGTLAEESAMREKAWQKTGCNAFDSDRPKSTPMAFWREQDVLQYIYDNKLPICSVYGNVIRKDKQMTFNEIQTGEIQYEYETTGAKRTGCMLCGFGCHLEKEPSRFERLKETHPKMYAMLDIVKNNGITMREAIEWINEHSKAHIRL